MNKKFGWNRRSFLAALGTLSGGLFAPSELNAARFLGKKHKPSIPAVDGGAIVPITSGLGSTGDVYAELGVTPLININGTLTVIGGSVMKPDPPDGRKAGGSREPRRDDCRHQSENPGDSLHEYPVRQRQGQRPGNRRHR